MSEITLDLMVKKDSLVHVTASPGRMTARDNSGRVLAFVQAADAPLYLNPPTHATLIQPAQEARMESPATLREQAARLLAEAKTLESLPVDDFEEGNVITFTKRFHHGPNVSYNYAAIKAADRWYLTGRETHGFVWQDLLRFVGFDNLDSITYVTAERALV